MTNRETLRSLAEQVEALSGPNREIGREVLLACGWTKTCVGHFYGPMYRWRSPDGKIGFDDDDFRRHDPTDSIDAAMTLAMAGQHLAFDPHFMSDEGVVRYRGYSFQPDWAKWNPHDMEWLNRDGSEYPLCATPALALTAASLRAIAEVLATPPSPSPDMDKDMKSHG